MATYDPTTGAILNIPISIAHVPFAALASADLVALYGATSLAVLFIALPAVHAVRARRARGQRPCLGVAAAVTALAAIAPFAPSSAAGQKTDHVPPSTAYDTALVVPGAEYEAGALRQALLGEGWRDLWTTRVRARVFDFDDYAGGVEWTERGGGNQSITLHLLEEGGWREHNFRSVHKYPEQAMPSAVRGTLAGWVVRDIMGSYFPAAPMIVPPFLEAVGLLHIEPVLRVMPDDPRLGVYQDTFAGMLATVEVKANEAPGDEPGFAGSRKIKGTDEFYNDLEESKAHRLDERRFLAARLVDFLINDTDRTMNNMRWARYGEEGDYSWRPLPVDRDWAFVDAGGLVPSLIRRAYPKLVGFGPEYPPVGSLTYASFLLDRRLLQRLTREDFHEIARDVAAAITDDVIEASIARMPAAWRERTDAPERIRTALRARRTQLTTVADAFYELLAEDVDIRGTDEPEAAVVDRLPDGRVRVTMTWPDDQARAGLPFYDRTFLPHETDEIRLHLLGGDDVARVVGSPSADIVVRLVGGEGDDVIIDDAGGGATRLYDAEGDNRLRAAATSISRAQWDPPQPNEGLRVGSDFVPDWGGGMGWRPAFDYGDAAGIVIGAVPTWTRYGFRRLPYEWKLDARLLYALGDGTVGGDVAFDYRFENSPFALTLDARAVGFHSFRYYGLGNETADIGNAALVPEDLIRVRSAVRYHIGWRDREDGGALVGGDASDDGGNALRPIAGRISLGPELLWTDADPPEAAPYPRADRVSFLRGGVRARLELDRTDRDAVPRRGWRLSGDATVYSPGADISAGFGGGRAEGRAYLPVIGSAHAAFRLGGAFSSDAAPARHTAWIGGRTTLRGYPWQRYRGDAATYASAELRIPATRVELLLRWNVGVFGLADAGRVWAGGEDSDAWHGALGGGLWLDALDLAFSITYARGAEDRLYLQTGLPF